jgi:hypothetical protein
MSADTFVSGHAAPMSNEGNPSDIIGAEEIASSFSDSAVAKAAGRARLPAGTDLSRLANDVRASVEQYVAKSCQASSNSVRRQMGALVRAGARRDYVSLADLLDHLSPEAKDLLDERYRRHSERRPRRGGDRISWALPDSAALRELGTREKAADAIVSLAVMGGHSCEGRRRPGGKRSREWRWYLHAPAPSRSEPRREAERQFHMFLRIDYERATGRKPPTTARLDMLGPFGRFLAECLSMARAPVTHRDPHRTGLAAQLMNDFARKCRRAELEAEWHQVLQPLVDASQAVAEVAALIEDGTAKVRSVAPGEDKFVIADGPALIEFQETGTLCFYLSPTQRRTIPLEAAKRTRIMQLADRLRRGASRQLHRPRGARVRTCADYSGS